MACRPTLLGLKGGIFAAAVGLVFLATPYSNLFFLLLSFLIVLGGLGLYWTQRNLRGIAVELRPVAPFPSDSRCELQLCLRGSRRSRFQITCRTTLAEGGASLGQVLVLAGEHTLCAPIGPLPRGVHALTAVTLTSRYPFGILQCTRTLPLAGELVVYPAPPAATHARGHAAMAPGQALAGGTSLAEARPAGLRPWHFGDGLRSVHWKASARRTQLVVREHEPESDRGIDVVLDRRAAQPAFERALSTIAGLLLRLEHEPRRLRIATQGHTAVHGHGEQPVADGLRWLAQVQPLPPDAAPPPTASGDAIRLPTRAMETRHG